MERIRKKNIRRIISLVCIAAVAAFLAAMPLIARQTPEDDGPQASILSGTTAVGAVDTALIGGGTLTEEAAQTIRIPTAVKLTAFLVSNGDQVEEGTPVAAVDRVSVMTAISEVQQTLEYLAEELEAEREEDAQDEVKALAGGTVKHLYAREGMSVQEVMLEYGSLAVLSLDGLMAVDLETDSDLRAGDSVTVTFSDCETTEGKVESNLAGAMTVSLEDEKYTPGDSVTVSTEDEVVGSGELYILNPWNATAYTGIVESIEVTEGEQVDAGTTLMELSGVGNTAAYRQLLTQRQKYEERMLELFAMYQTERITAPCDGVVSGVDPNSVQLLAAGQESYGIVFLANAPNGDDETQYTNFVGQITAIGEEGIGLKLNPDPIAVTDYKDLSSIPTDTGAMTRTAAYNAAAPIYTLSGGNWVQISEDALHMGDILLFACDESGNFVWVVRLIAAEQEEPEDPSEPTEPTEPTEPEDPSEPTVPGEPTEPTDPTDPTVPGEPTDPTEPTQPGQQPGTPNPSGTGKPSGGTWGSTASSQEGNAEPEFELYGLELADVMLVTPQSNMTVEITVDELDIRLLKIGMEAQVKIMALGGEKFSATVTDIGNTGQNNGGNSKFTVELTMERSGDMLPGMSAAVSIPLSSVHDAVILTADALVEEGTRTLVYTGYDEENQVLTDPVTVTVGVSDGQTVQILEGLEAGTRCYYAYYDTLQISNAPDFSSRGFRFG